MGENLMVILEQEKVLNLNSGQLCLDFTNTTHWHAGDDSEEHLNSYTDLVVWAKQAGVLAEDETQKLLREAKLHPQVAAAVLEQAIALREAIYRIFSTAPQGHLPEPADLAILNQTLSLALAQLRLVSTTDGIGWKWAGEMDQLDRVLWPVAQSAAQLLTSEELNRVGECAAEECSWLFLDTSRNRSRRWCDMGDCGNRAKARRHYRRKQAQDQ
jgi:predicted RNA-binding Zn ribbon-like protein